MSYFVAKLLPIVIQVAIVLFCITIHEYGHGRVARMLGDPTAEAAGRLSFNPIRHIDPFGTIILPLLLIIAGLPPFGYAKPVPIDPRHFKDYRMGLFLTGVAGPASNVASAAVVGGVFRILTPYLTGAGQTANQYVILGFVMFVEISIVLAVFNLLPVPPLDGSRVLPLFLSDRGMRLYREIERYGILIVFLLLFVPVIREFVFTIIFAIIGPIVNLLLGQKLF